jgi:predicted secreted hydrolase
MNMSPHRPNLLRRQLLQGLTLPWLAAGTAAARDDMAAGPAAAPAQGLVAALRPRPLEFPADHGSHNAARTEWWYLTGYLRDARQRLYGFQVTFFRSRIDAAQSLRSRLAARQLLFAHAALTDVQGQRHWHDQRIARWNGLPAPTLPAPAGASAQDTDVRLGRWRLLRQPDGRYAVSVQAPDFSLDLQAASTGPLLLQGERGWSRKGPQPAQASFYYSRPQLQASGHVRLQRESSPVKGRAWLDHEWSESLLHPEAVGWDWIGMNLDQGGSLTAFRLRRADGTSLWAGGSFRAAQSGAGSQERIFAPDSVAFEATRHWSSPRTGIRYPVAWRLTTPAGHFEVQALVDDQELDGRPGTGTVYWEGLSELRRADGQQRIGLGYLELTGYGQPLRL